MDTLLKATVRDFFGMLTSKRATVSYADKRDAGRISAVLTLMSELANEMPVVPLISLPAERSGAKAAKEDPAQAKTGDENPKPAGEPTAEV
jgi:hypothetical protein